MLEHNHCVGAGRTQPDSCVAPLVRLDTPGNSRLSGIVRFGSLCKASHSDPYA